MQKDSLEKITGAIIFLIGILFLINSEPSLSGAMIGIYTSAGFFNLLIGAVLIIISIIIVGRSGLEKITLTSNIKNQPLLRLTHNAVENQEVQRAIDHLTKELSKGNFEAGLGHPGHIGGTDIFYLRARNEARLYYHKIGANAYEIVAKSAKGRNQDQVINKLREIYGH